MFTLARSVLAAWLLVAVLAQPASADDIIRIGRDVASGRFALASADAVADYPKALWVKVRARPNQRVDVSWSLRCVDESETRSRGREFSARTPVKRELRILFAEAEACSVSALASLHDRGRIVVLLLARVPDHPPLHTVTYEVTGATPTVDVTYENEDGNGVQASGVSVPWTYSFDAVEGTFVYVGAQKDASEDGDVTCSLYVNGILWEANTSTGPLAICEAWADL